MTTKGVVVPTGNASSGTTELKATTTSLSGTNSLIYLRRPCNPYIGLRKIFQTNSLFCRKWVKVDDVVSKFPKIPEEHFQRKCSSGIFGNFVTTSFPSPRNVFLAGSIAGIVIGVVIGNAVLGVAGFFAIRYCCRRQRNSAMAQATLDKQPPPTQGTVHKPYIPFVEAPPPVKPPLPPPATTTSESSKKVITNVRILERLGGGNFGDVYRGIWNVRWLRDC